MKVIELVKIYIIYEVNENFVDSIHKFEERRDNVTIICSIRKCHEKKR